MVLRCPTCGEKALALLMLKDKSSAPGYRKWGQYGVYECSVCGHREIVK
jgi:DNA-directed RNA polymerase subunit RPC12/RpoP